MVIEREFFSKNPREIATKAFHENFHYPAGDLLKTREFYETILVETGSVKIKHNADKFSNLDLAFSTCHIYKILTVKQWVEIPIFQRSCLNCQNQDFSTIGIIREHSSMLF